MRRTSARVWLVAATVALGVLAMPWGASADSSVCVRGRACAHARAHPEAVLGRPDSPYAYRYSYRALAGLTRWADAPSWEPAGGFGAAFVTEFASRPFLGAFSTALSLYGQGAPSRWAVAGIGIAAELDLSYVLASGLWSVTPPDDLPVIVRVGVRVAFAYSQSYPNDVPGMGAYSLIRVELQPCVDFEVPLTPLTGTRSFALLVRASGDWSINLSDLYRWAVLVGLTYGWDDDG